MTSLDDPVLDPAQVMGQRLHAERKRLGLSQAKLAESLGVTRLTVLGYEAGRATPDVGVLLRAARELPLDLVYLVTGERVTQADRSWALIRAALEVLQAWLRRRGLSMSPEEEGDLLRELYMKFMASLDDRPKS